jgi:hypothetical protein
MDLRRVRAGELLATVAAVVLLVDLKRTWFAVPGVEVDAFEAFSVIDILLLVVALLGLAVGVVTAIRRAPALPLAVLVVTAFCGVLMVPVLALRIINEPGDNAVVDVRFGAYLGFVALAGIAVGAWLALRDERLDAAP